MTGGLQNPAPQRRRLTSGRCDLVSVTFCHFIFVSSRQRPSQEAPAPSVCNQPGGATSRRSALRGRQINSFPQKNNFQTWGGDIVGES